MTDTLLSHPKKLHFFSNMVYPLLQIQMNRIVDYFVNLNVVGL